MHIELNTIFKISWKAIKYYSIFHVVTEYMIPLRLMVCRGASMQPALNNNDVILVENFSVLFHQIRQ